MQFNHFYSKTMKHLNIRCVWNISYKYLGEKRSHERWTIPGLTKSTFVNNFNI